MVARILLAVDQETKTALLHRVLASISTFPDTSLVCADGAAQVNRLALALLLPSLATLDLHHHQEVTLLLPQHSLEELGLTIPLTVSAVKQEEEHGDKQEEEKQEDEKEQEDEEQKKEEHNNEKETEEENEVESFELQEYTTVDELFSANAKDLEVKPETSAKPSTKGGKIRRLRAAKALTSLCRSQAQVKQSFKSRFLTAKFLVGTLQERNGLPPDFALFMEANAHSPGRNRSRLAGRVLACLGGRLRQRFLTTGLHYHPDSCYLMATDEGLEEDLQAKQLHAGEAQARDPYSAHKVDKQDLDQGGEVVSSRESTVSKQERLSTAPRGTIRQRRSTMAARTPSWGDRERPGMRKTFKTGFLTAKFLVATLQRRNGLQANFALLVRENAHGPSSPSPLADKVLVYARGPLREAFLGPGLIHDPSYMVMANLEDLQEDTSLLAYDAGGKTL